MSNKLTELTEDSGITDDDILYKVNDPTGTPSSRKITWANFKATLKTYFDTLYAGVLGADDNYVTDAEKISIGTIGDKENVSNKSTNVVADGASDIKYPSVKAIKDYADSLVAGLTDLRGTYDASTNVFPSTGGSGTAGAILKGDTWVISVAGTLGGNPIQIGDWIIALVDTPGSTDSNWGKLNTNITYVSEDEANKKTDLDANKTSNTFYATCKSIYDWGVGLFVQINGALGTPTTGTLTNCTGLPVSGITSSTTTALGVGSIELGHATDTTLTRVSAGVVAIEGVNIVKAGSVTTNGVTMNTGKLLGRSTASSGAIEEITLGTNLSFDGTTLNASTGTAITSTAGTPTGADRIIEVVSLTTAEYTAATKVGTTLYIITD